jgi:hypothetical protein
MGSAQVLVVGQVRRLLGSKTQSPTWKNAAIQEQFGFLIQNLKGLQKQPGKQEPKCQNCNSKAKVRGSRLVST